MQEQEVEVSFCDLCGASVPADDLSSKRAVQHQGKTIGGCCLPALREVSEQPAGSPVVPGIAAGESATRAGGDGSRLVTVAVLLLVAMAGGFLFLDSKLSGVAADLAGRQAEAGRRQRADSEILMGVQMKLGDVPERAALAGVQDQLDGLAERLGALEDAGSKRQAVLDQELDGLRRSVAGAEDKIVDYRPLFEDLRQRHSRAIAVIEGLRDRAAASPAAAAPAPVVEEPPASAPADDLPADLAEQVAKLAAADPAVRFEAVDVLIESKNSKVLSHLVPLAKDPDAFVRRLTVEGLREFAQAEAVDALIEALGDEDENVCDTAWRSLRDLTGQKLAFDASATKESRARAARKWQEWWAKARASFGS